MEPLRQNIRYIKGVGEKRAKLFEKLGAPDVGALLRFYPRDYQDWTPRPLLECPIGAQVCVWAQLDSPIRQARVRKGLTLYKFDVCDREGARMQVTLFNSAYLAASLKPRTGYLFYGKMEGTFSARAMSAPQIRPAAGAPALRPVYHTTAGLTSAQIESTVANALDVCGTMEDCLPFALREKYGMCSLTWALRNIHFPSDAVALDQARERLIFEELFLLQLGLRGMRAQRDKQQGVRIRCDETAAFFAALPFTPTKAQQRATAECMADMASGRCMNRLLQGDVGSGKTAVAAALCESVIASGFQCAVMAPTEILARQHFSSFGKMLPGRRVALLTGSTKKAERTALRQAMADGGVDLVVGTHALLEDDVVFRALGLVVTDEQHRFGVAQRTKLGAKAKSAHTLVISATPIPRTLSFIIFGDLDVSILDELPRGRKPVRTYAVQSALRERVYAYVRKHIAAGRQAYIVCPMIEENEQTAPLAAAQTYARTLAEGPFRDLSVGLLHGRLKPKEKDAVMRAFAEGALSLLVCTTVVEVGVDVPNATVMVIENAERFGLAQLHQLRGRIGRGAAASACILISDAKAESALARLRILVGQNDGFRIADEDLRLRGPGDFLGRQQHGLPKMRIADMAQDLAVLRTAAKEVDALLSADPGLKRHSVLREAVATLFEQTERYGVN